MVEFVTWRDYVQNLSIPRMLRPVAERFFGTFGLIADTANEGYKLALFANWLLEPTSPDDVLPKIGRERRLPRYPAETAAQHRARLHAAWDTWVAAGSDPNMIDQFAAAGWPGVLIFDNVDIYQWEDPHDTTYISRFWVIMPPESHTFTTDGNWDDAGTWNDGGLWNSGNATTEQVETMRGIIRKFKPVDWICAGIVAVVSWDDPTLTQESNFSSVNWTKGVSTVITGDAVTGPTLGTFADQITNSSGSPAATIYVSQTPGNIEAGRPTYYVMDAKAGTATWLVYSDGGSSFAHFDLVNGEVGLVIGGVYRATMTDLGNGFWRCIAITSASPDMARWYVADADNSIVCPAGEYAYLYQADIYNYKFGEAIHFGAR